MRIFVVANRHRDLATQTFDRTGERTQVRAQIGRRNRFFSFRRHGVSNALHLPYHARAGDAARAQRIPR